MTIIGKITGNATGHYHEVDRDPSTVGLTLETWVNENRRYFTSAPGSSCPRCAEVPEVTGIAISHNAPTLREALAAIREKIAKLQEHKFELDFLDDFEDWFEEKFKEI